MHLSFLVRNKEALAGRVAGECIVSPSLFDYFITHVFAIKWCMVHQLFLIPTLTILQFVKIPYKFL